MKLSSHFPSIPPNSFRESTGWRARCWIEWIPKHNQGQDQQNITRKHIVQIDEKHWNMLLCGMNMSLGGN